MHDTSVTKADAHYSPKGEMGTEISRLRYSRSDALVSGRTVRRAEAANRPRLRDGRLRDCWPHGATDRGPDGAA